MTNAMLNETDAKASVTVDRTVDHLIPLVQRSAARAALLGSPVPQRRRVPARAVPLPAVADRGRGAGPARAARLRDKRLEIQTSENGTVAARFVS